MLRRVAVVLLAVLGIACTGSDDLPSVVGAPVFADESMPTTITAPGALTNLVVQDGQIIATTADRVLAMDASSLDELTVRMDDASEGTTGSIFSLVPRSSDTLVAAEAGCFETWSDGLQPSPLVLSMRPRAMDWSGDTLWVAADDGLYEISSGTVKRWTMDEAPASPPIAVRAIDDVVLVAFDTALFELDAAAQTSVHIDYDFGQIRAIAAGSTHTAYLATSRGLVVRSSDGSYRRFTLSASEEGVNVDAVAADPQLGVIAATAIGLVGLDGDVPVGYVAIGAAQAKRSIATDDFGQTWVADGDSLRGWIIAEPVSFAADIRPILSAHCDSCHIDGSSAPAIDMKSHEAVRSQVDSIIERLTLGTMPPSPNPSLSTEEYQLFRRWYGGGQAE